MLKKFTPYIIVLIAGLCCFTSCSEKTEIADMSLSAEINGLPPLNGAFYHLYLQNGEEFFYVTRIDPAADSTWTLDNEPFDPVQLDAAQQVLIVVNDIENPTGDPDGATLLATDWNGINGTLSIGHSFAVGDPFRTQNGEYLIYSPSTSDTTDFINGIWFYDTTRLDSFTLQLPEINDTWTYEAWLTVDEADTTLSLGRFSAADVDDSGDPFTSDEIETFNFPGEDFIQNLPSTISTPLDVRNRRLFITLEPVDDPDRNRPFPIVILDAITPADTLARRLEAETLIPIRAFPEGTVSR